MSRNLALACSRAARNIAMPALGQTERQARNYQRDSVFINSPAVPGVSPSRQTSLNLIGENSGERSAYSFNRVYTAARHEVQRSALYIKPRAITLEQGFMNSNTRHVLYSQSKGENNGEQKIFICSVGADIRGIYRLP
jgi:hypothetical protein